MHHGHPIFTVITRFGVCLFFIPDPRDRYFYTAATGNKEKVLLHLCGQRVFSPVAKGRVGKFAAYSAKIQTFFNLRDIDSDGE